MAGTTKTIFDLDILCLRHILRCLDKGDLLQVAEAVDILLPNHHELDVSNKRNASNKVLQFSNVLREMLLQKHEPVTDVEITHLKPLEYFVRVLRYFGTTVKALRVNYEDICDKGKTIDAAILRYCRESLVSIQLDHVSSENFANISQTFPRVEEVTIFRGFVNKQLSEFERRFPKVRVLHLIEARFENPHCVDCSFTHLREFKIRTHGYNYSKYIRNIFSHKITANSELEFCLEINTQLKNLHLDEETDKCDINIGNTLMFFLKRSKYPITGTVSSGQMCIYMTQR